MKVRNGFVTNSSSSSFCIIGVNDENLIKRMLIAEGINNENTEYGVLEGNLLDYYGSSGYFYNAGKTAEELLETMTIPEAVKYMQKYIKENFFIDVELDQIGFFYGEMSDD